MGEGEEDADYCPKDFHEMELDDRILKAVAKLGWEKPTLIQERAIPLLLEGKDVLVRARTGSGKTGAFGIPVIQKILHSKQVGGCREGVQALILAPSRELCRQIHSHLISLTAKCSKDVSLVNISVQGDVKAVAPLLSCRPDVVISTPGRALDHLKASTLSLSTLHTLVIDEADLVFSFGHDEDVKQVIKYLPRVYQACLASATLSDSVLDLKRLVLRNAVTLRLEEPHLAPITQLSHYFLYAEEDDKAVYLYTLIKLSLLRGKTIVFTNTVDKCYKIKLYLEQFGIKVCVLNSELPASVRCHTVAQFNDGLYNIIVASDEAALESFNAAKQQKEGGKRKKDKESGVSRGIDFQFVSNVLNFDFPLDVNSYIHRAGRTARGNNQGTALSLISVAEKHMMEMVDQFLKAGLYQSDSIFKEYEMQMKDIEGFRYRSRDAWRAATRIAVREARLKEIRHEIVNNNKLKGYFEENPRELKTLRHDKFARTIKIQKHLGDVPDYLLPPGLRKQSVLTVATPDQTKGDQQETTGDTEHKPTGGKQKINKRQHRKHAPPSNLLAKKSNPLLNLDFEISKRKKRKMK